MATNFGEVRSATAAYGPSTIVNNVSRSLYHVAWYLGITNPGSAALSVATVTFRWNDGVSARAFTSAGLSLLSLGFLSGTLPMYAMDMDVPTFEVNMSSLLGSPEFVFRYQFSTSDMD